MGSAEAAGKLGISAQRVRDLWRDGALSGSTLKEASSWGKVDTAYEQMVFSEATLAVPLIAGYAYHKGAWKNRTEKRFARQLEPAGQAVS